MRLIHNMVEYFGLCDQENRIFWLFFFLALVVLLPNAMIFSIDEVNVYMSPRPLYGLGLAQAGDGRYTFAALCWFLSVIRIDFLSFAVLSVVAFAFSLAAIYIAMLRMAREEINATTIIGFFAFLTFGMSLDQLQFVDGYLSYAGAMLAVCALGALASSSWKPLNILALGTVIFALGIGIYQSTLQITAYFILAFAALRIAAGGGWKPVLARAALMGGCAVLGSVIYVATNATLKHAGVAWFQLYPLRAQGLSYVPANLPLYCLTIAQAFGAGGQQYITLVPYVVALLIFLVMVFYFTRCGRQGVRPLLIAMLLVLAALCIFPDPANLLLAIYWPSPRSMCAFGLFIAALLNVLCRDRAGTCLALILVAAQIVVVVKNDSRRFEQWTADTAVAEQLILDSYQNTPAGETPTITLGVSWRNLNIAMPLPYNFGISMFGAPWSATSFVRYISGGDVNVVLDDGKACAKPRKFLTITPTGDGIRACFEQN